MVKSGQRANGGESLCRVWEHFSRRPTSIPKMTTEAIEAFVTASTTSGIIIEKSVLGFAPPSGLSCAGKLLKPSSSTVAPRACSGNRHDRVRLARSLASAGARADSSLGSAQSRSCADMLICVSDAMLEVRAPSSELEPGRTRGSRAAPQP